MTTCGCNSGLDQAIAAAKAATTPTEARADNRLDIDLMYIDLSVCDRCQGTEQNLDEAIASVEPLLKSAGYSVNLSKILVESEEQARELQFVTSPTIRINGRDIQLEATESHCSSCSSLVEDEPIDCRSWEYKGESFDAPPTAMIIEAIVMHVFDAAPSEDKKKPERYQVPENLKRFFAAREAGAVNSSGSCDTSCNC